MSRIGEVNEVAGKTGEFEWRIRNFSTLLEKADGWFCSPLFSFADESWGMLIYPNGQKQCNSAGYIDIDLGRLSTGPTISLKFSFWLKTLNGKKEFQQNHSHVYQYTYEKKEISKIVSRTDLLKRKYDLLPSGELIVVCSLECAEPEKHLKSERCPNCKETLDAETISLHKKKCIARPIKCPECTHVIPLQDWYDHNCSPARTKDDTKTAECSFCKEILNVECITSHENKCIERPIKCPDCRDIVILKDWYNHQCKPSSAKDETASFKCPYCKISLDALCLSPNEKSCIDELIKCPKYLEVFGTKELCEHECLMARAEAKQKLLNDLRHMMLSGDYSDITVKMKTEEFHLHKCILRIRSPYFDSVLQKEIEGGVISSISDYECEPEHFRSFIHYIYTGAVDNLSTENVSSLYEVANMYQENHLKAECLQVMMNAMSVNNFCDFIALAIKYDEEKLLEKASEMFVTKTKEIIRIPKWNIFAKEYPTQANELFMKTLEKDDLPNIE